MDNGNQIERLPQESECREDGNVLVGSDGHLYFIDTIIYLSDTGGYDTYRSLSPRFSK